MKKVDAALSRASVSLSERWSQNEKIKKNRTNFLREWENKSPEKIEKEINKIKKKFRDKPVAMIDGDLYGPAWQVAALYSLLEK